MLARLLFLGSLLGTAACATGLGYLNSFSPAAPASPSSDRDAAVAAALSYAFVEPGDVHGGRALPQRRRIALCAELGCWDDGPPDPLTPRMLPMSRRVEFVLLSRAEIEALAREVGRVDYGVVGRPEVVGDSAAVFVGVRSLAPERSMSPREFSHGGSGYVFQFEKRAGAWLPVEGGVRYYVDS
jgi:hypothetical protein